jgi:hypothetical protein
LATLRRATPASAWPPELSVMWCDSFRKIAVAGSPSDDRSECVSSSIRDPLTRSACASDPGSTAVLLAHRPADHRVRDAQHVGACASLFAAICTSARPCGTAIGSPGRYSYLESHVARSPPRASSPVGFVGPASSASANAAASGSLPVPFAPRFTPDRYNHRSSSRTANHKCRNRRCAGTNLHGRSFQQSISHHSHHWITCGPIDAGNS